MVEKNYFNLCPSRNLSIWILLVHGGALVVPVFLDLYFLIRWGLVFTILISLYYQLRNYSLLKGPQAIIALEALSSQIWCLYCRNGQSFLANLSDNSLILPSLMILHFSIIKTKRRKRVPICIERKNQDIFRQLAVFLHF